MLVNVLLNFEIYIQRNSKLVFKMRPINKKTKTVTKIKFHPIFKMLTIHEKLNTVKINNSPSE